MISVVARGVWICWKSGRCMISEEVYILKDMGRKNTSETARAGGVLDWFGGVSPFNTMSVVKGVGISFYFV